MIIQKAARSADGLDFVLYDESVDRAGDVIVAVGTREGLDGVARLLANGPD